ncbi:MAG: hypothetical protein ACKVQU_20205 [Burkholderiales bacterium]
MPDLNPVYGKLKAILQPYADRLETKINTDTELYIDTRHIQANRKPLFFGAVQIKKHYVSFHLMPVYVDPSLLEGMSEGLRKRMQGKSCFNFKQTDPVLFKELAILAKSGFAMYEAQGFV